MAFALLVAGCARKVTRTLVSPVDVATLDSRSPVLKAHMPDGGVYVLEQWRVDAATAAIDGQGVRMDADRVQIDSGTFRVPADSVALFETNVEEGSGASTALTVMVGVTAVVAGICAVDPKTCFGSCPTFYAPGRNGDLELQAEGFSSSIAPALEATDIDMLPNARPTGRSFELRVTNEALETHVIRHADVLAALRPPDGRVYVTSQGTFREARHPVPPTRCIGSEGDCLSEVLLSDGIERHSLADSTDLAAKEVVDLEFSDVPEGELGLVVASRQTFITTFLIYQALAYLGDDAGRWLARLGTGGSEALRAAGGIGGVLGNIEILVPDGHGTWVVVGSVGETGPIATDTRLAPLGSSDSAPRRIRLRMTRGMWRIDHVALVALGQEVTPRRISPSTARKSDVSRPDVVSALTHPDDELVTLPGDAYTISYVLPENPTRYELFLEARGYYLEWMRREWMSEKNPALAAQLLLDPRSALRMLAPRFKEREASFEHLFWNSRYVR